MKTSLTVNNQAAFEYVLYMIASSYFENANCVTGATESKLRLNYREQKANSQYRMEEFCISFMDRFAERIGTDMFRRNVEVRLVRLREDRPVSVIFSGEGFRMTLTPEYLGNGSRIRYSLKYPAAA